jgi:anti-sigma regulatory factor (Ser/Thr protein kinase)
MPAHLHLTFPHVDVAPHQAREAIAREFGSSLDPEQLADAKLLTSELVTNAYLHGEGDIVVHARLEQHHLIVEVIDQGSGFERKLRQGNFDEIGRHGLEIVDSVASRWGLHDGTTHVWFELERHGPRLGTPPPG